MCFLKCHVLLCYKISRTLKSDLLSEMEYYFHVTRTFLISETRVLNITCNDCMMDIQIASAKAICN